MRLRATARKKSVRKWESVSLGSDSKAVVNREADSNNEVKST